MKKLVLHSEIVYLFAIMILSLAVAMIASTGFGVSMVVAPAYILSEKVDFLTFGYAEYIIQAVLFAVFCIIMRRVRLVYFSSFLTGIIYGFVLDMWRLIPFLNPNITEPGSYALWLRVLILVIGMLLTAISIALFFGVYLYPQVYDFFTKGVSEKLKINLTKFKICYDISSLVISAIMMIVLFGYLYNPEGFVGIGIGTVIMTCFNGLLIGVFSKLFKKIFIIKPIFPKFAVKFDF